MAAIDAPTRRAGRRWLPFAAGGRRALGRQPLAAYLGFLLAVFVVATASGAAYVRWQSEGDAVRASQRDANFVAQLVAARLDSNGVTTLRNGVAQAAASARLGTTFPAPGSCTIAYPFTPASLLPAGHFDVLGADGSVACSSRPRTGPPATVQASWMAAALRGPQLLAPVPDPYDAGKNGILSTTPIAGRGVVVGFSELRPLAAAIARYYSDPRGREFLITTSDGRTSLVRSIDPERWAGTSLTGTAFVQPDDPLERADVRGTPRVYGESVVAATGWKVYVGETRASALAAPANLSQRQLGVVLVGLLLALAAVVALHRGLTRPIQQLSLAIRAATDRAAPQPVVARGPREVLSLAQDFNVLIASVNRELGERQRAEEEVRQLNLGLEAKVVQRTAELEAANSELEAFCYSVSHDLRAPLRAVSGLSRMVMEQHAGHLSEEAQRLLGQTVTNAKQMGQLIDALLTLSRLGRQGLSRDTVEPALLVEEIMNDLQPEIDGRRIELTVGELPPLRADRMLMRQVVANLLSNAIKFTAERDPAVIEIGCRVERGHNVYYVRDNGAGFDMRYADKLFQVFQRLHSNARFAGTGIGLALVDRILKRHGGRIWAEGAINGGATFSFMVGGGPDR